MSAGANRCGFLAGDAEAAPHEELLEKAEGNVEDDSFGRARGAKEATPDPELGLNLDAKSDPLCTGFALAARGALTPMVRLKPRGGFS